MIVERWLDLVKSVPLPSWVPTWSPGLAVPLIALILYGVVSRIVPYLVGATRREAFALALKQTRIPIQIIILTALTQSVVYATRPTDAVLTVLDQVVPLVFVLAVAILAYRVTGIFFIVLRRRFDTSGADNLSARRVTTQIIVLERVVGFVIVILAIAIGLITIPGVRQWGTSILASAGVLGLLVGFAAQQTIANVLAGIQIAITQPLRIDDSVVIDGEWGSVEEITLTYIVVRVWDKRRLVVPISYLLERPFQNWTRNSASIIGTVFLYADYTVDIDALRVEQSRTLAASELWDGEVDTIQVTNTTDRTIELRSLVSAKNAPAAWELRCILRERLVRFLATEQPNALPRERMRLQGTISNKES